MAVLLSRRFPGCRRTVDGIQKRLSWLKSKHDLADENGSLNPGKVQVFLEVLMRDNDLSEPNLHAGLSESDQELVQQAVVDQDT